MTKAFKFFAYYKGRDVYYFHWAECLWQRREKEKAHSEKINA